jgi:NADPH:quinone reductase-like Zn-dependent oxidoreductase
MNPNPNLQKIAVFHKFGGPEVVAFEEAAAPLASTLRNNELLIHVKYSTVNSADCRIRSRNVPCGFGTILGLLYGFTKPKLKVLGLEAAGEVVAIGADVCSFQLHDRVLVNLGFGMGGHQEYIVIGEKAHAVKIPDDVSYEKAVASVFGGTTALLYLRDKLMLQPEQNILITGAGGAVGSAAVQIALAMGANVTAVCSTEKTALVQKLGAHAVIDYQKSDWKARPTRYDAIFDSVGLFGVEDSIPWLKEYGKAALMVADLPLNLKCLWFSLTHKQKIFAGAASPQKSDLEVLLMKIKNRQLDPVIGKVVPFSDIRKAHELAESGHKLGSVLLKMD